MLHVLDCPLHKHVFPIIEGLMIQEVEADGRQKKTLAAATALVTREAQAATALRAAAVTAARVGPVP